MKIENAKKKFIHPRLPQVKVDCGNQDGVVPKIASCENGIATQISLRFCFCLLAATAALYVMMVYDIYVAANFESQLV